MVLRSRISEQFAPARTPPRKFTGFRPKIANSPSFTTINVSLSNVKNVRLAETRRMSANPWRLKMAEREHRAVKNRGFRKFRPKISDFSTATFYSSIEAPREGDNVLLSGEVVLSKKI
jgi:hypothetical protein